MKNTYCPITLLGRKAAQKLGRSAVKREAIVEAARAVFLAKGFDVASMDLIAAEANVSKRTVYSHFLSKENLFSSIMGEMCSHGRQDVLKGTDLESSDILKLDRPINEALSELGVNLLQKIFDPEAISLLRILVGQADKFPEIGQDYFNHGPRQMIATLAQYLAEMEKLGQIKIKNHELAAQMFLSSLLGSSHIECLVTACPPPDSEKINLMVASAVEIFEKGIKA